jgi:hypothetical protein
MAANQSAVIANEIRRWLASGRLQPASGAYCAWRDAEQGTLAFEYPEITGYALTWLAGCTNPDDGEIRAGRRAADWMVKRLNSGDRSARAGWDGGAVYTFDLGMIAAGLLSFGELVGERAYLEQGRATAAELARYVDSSAGLQAIAPDGPATDRPDGWSTVGRPHLVKCVQALLLAGERDAAGRLLGYATDAQGSDGRFRTQPEGDQVMLHPHIYTVEGLWMWGSACDDSEALERARKAITWAWKYQLPSGGMPRWVSDSETGPEQLDVTSQAIRAAILLDVKPEGLEAATSRLAGLARADEDHGSALIYQPDADGTHLNAWVSMFAGQALSLAADGPQAVRWNTLV